MDTDNKLYNQDFYSWTQQQAEFLRTGRLNQLDIANLTEEVLSMGRSEYNALESRLTRLLSHLLKWQYQPERRGRSWRLTVVEQRKRARKVLDENPGLKQFLDAIYASAYDYAVLAAAKETELPRKTFPPESPWTFDQIMQEEWLP
ncbi:DUF29 domain-containing protein [Endozoicomonas sp. ALE010]|uniref:DUF29 domain-containing protein n=1 Tax=Endozoicomonas sp. ALE010 TaxID=3403081 RepID=UPI003BB64DFF